MQFAVFPVDRQRRFVLQPVGQLEGDVRIHHPGACGQNTQLAALQPCEAVTVAHDALEAAGEGI